MDCIEPLGYMCPRFQKKCEFVKDCSFRMHNDECMERTEFIRRLGTMKRIQLTMLLIGKTLENEDDWRECGREILKIWRQENKAQDMAEGLYP